MTYDIDNYAQLVLNLNLAHKSNDPIARLRALESLRDMVHEDSARAKLSYNDLLSEVVHNYPSLKDILN
jgi:hypothetical protein